MPARPHLLIYADGTDVKVEVDPNMDGAPDTDRAHLRTIFKVAAILTGLHALDLPRVDGYSVRVTCAATQLVEACARATEELTRAGYPALDVDA
jgi:hypothetical protein